MPLYPIQDTFVRGEISPRLHSRASLDLYRAGLSKCENFVTLPHGGIRKRGGTYFVAATKDSSTKAIVVPFVFSAEQAYALELGDEYLRVYAYGSRVGTVEVTTPWAEDDLAELQFEQSADVMWVTHDAYPPHRIVRTGHESWSVEAEIFTDGPFGSVNTDEAKTMSVSVVTVGTNRDLNATFAAFTPDMVGNLVRLDMEDYSNILPWEPYAVLRPLQEGSATAVGIRRRYNGNVYVVSASEETGYEIRTGTTPPEHTEGREWDGPNLPDTTNPDLPVWSGVQWEYIHSGYGIARITDYVNSGQVKIEVIRRFPEQLVSGDGDTHLWRMSAFTADDYPTSITLFEERLTYGRKFSVYASRTGDFTSFETGEADDDALTFVNAGGGQANDIVWLSDSDGALIIGTTGGIRTMSGSGIDEALTPSSFKNRKARSSGCARIMPVDAGASFLYVTRSRKAIAELTETQTGRFTTDDISQISEHIPKKGIVTLAFQNDPDPYLWFPLGNGELGGMTLQPSQEVRGMHRHRIAGSFAGSEWGIVESIAVTPGQDGVDDVWLVVKRTIDGTTKRYIEIMQPAFEYDLVTEAFQVDCGLSRDGSAVNAVSGLDHLEGETVSVLADGKVYNGLIVTDGGVELPSGATAARWHVGLPVTCSANTLELDVGGKDGSIVGRRKKVHALMLSLLETDTTGLEVSSLIKGRWEPVRIRTNAASDGKANLFTGNIEVPIDDSWEGQGRVSIRHANPTPCTIRSVTPIFDAEP